MIPDSPAQDCRCGHPAREHAGAGEKWCMVASCPCGQFAGATSKVKHLDRCYLCDRPAHADGRCPYVHPK